MAETAQKALGPQWSLTPVGDDAFQLQAPPSEILKEFGTAKSPGDYRVARTLRSVFEGAKYNPGPDQAQHKEALSNSRTKPKVERQLTPERQPSPLRAKLEGQISKKSQTAAQLKKAEVVKVTEDLKKEAALVEKLLRMEFLSPLQRTVLSLLRIKAQRHQKILSVKKAMAIADLAKRVPAKLPSLKNQVFTTIFTRFLTILPKDQLPTEQQLDSLLMTARNTYIVGGEAVRELSNKRFADGKPDSEKKEEFKGKKGEEKQKPTSSSRFDKNIATDKGKDEIRKINEYYQDEETRRKRRNNRWKKGFLDSN
jgi:hypothetical protein